MVSQSVRLWFENVQIVFYTCRNLFDGSGPSQNGSIPWLCYVLGPVVWHSCFLEMFQSRYINKIVFTGSKHTKKTILLVSLTKPHSAFRILFQSSCNQPVIKVNIIKIKSSKVYLLLYMLFDISSSGIVLHSGCVQFLIL